MVIAAVMCAGVMMQAQRDDAAAREIFAGVNRARAAEHLAALQWEPSLARAAQSHSEGMAQQQQSAHVLPQEPPLAERIGNAGARVSAVGENVGYAGSAEAVEEAWMQSAGHRANILNADFDAVGIAAFRRGDKLYATEDFARLTQAISADDGDLQVRDAIAQARKERHLPPLAIRVLTGAHCTAAAFQAATATLGLGQGQARAIVDFTTADPGKLPGPLLERLAGPGYSSYSLSVCDLHEPKGFTLLNVHVALF